MRRLIVLVFVVVVAGVALVFAGLNKGTIVHLDLLFGAVDAPVSAIVLVAFASGWLVGLVAAGLNILRLMNERRRLRRSISVAQAEVDNLRSLPLRDDV